MDLLQLRYFEAIAQLQHMTKASSRLNVSQPALSKMLRRLEEELGVRLFDRKGKNLALNEDGAILLKYAGIVFQALDDAKVEMEDRREAADNRVNISIKVALACWTELVLAFKETHPEISLFFKFHHEKFSKDVKSDLEFYASSYEIDDGHTIKLGEEEFSLVLPKGHPLAGRKSVSLREMRDEPFICTSDDELRRTTEDMCRSAGFEPKIIMESDIYHSTLSFIKHGIGCAIVPSVTWMYKSDYGLPLIKIDDVVRRRYMYLGWRKNAYLSRAAGTFKDFMKYFFDNMEK